jgi:hypothetical protein
VEKFDKSVAAQLYSGLDEINELQGLIPSNPRPDTLFYLPTVDIQVEAGTGRPSIFRDEQS